MKLLNFVLFFLLCIFSLSLGQAIVINEIMSSNKDFIKDEDSTSSDWIEIFNASDSSICLSNYSLSDNIMNLSRWYFPDTTIDSKKYFLIFASGKNRRVTGRQLHTNFSIKNEGEDLFLAKNGEVVHKVNAVELCENQSYGLYPDAGIDFYKFINPSPGISNTYGQIEDEVIFSQNGGIYKNCFILYLKNKNPDNQIYYTTDGSIPTVKSNLYQKPLRLDQSLFSNANISRIKMSPDVYFHPPENIIKAIIIKAAVFCGEKMISNVVTNTYLINELGNVHYNFPIMSISAEYRDLFNDTVGIMVPGLLFNPNEPYRTGNYFAKGDEWERPAFIEFYESDCNLAFKQCIGIRTNGQGSRSTAQKSFRLYSRKNSDENFFNNKVFNDRDKYLFKHFVLRPFYASWDGTGTSSYITNKMAQNLNIDWLACKPVTLYINGEYWGIYFIEERIDKDYLKSNFNVDNDSIDIIEYWDGYPNEGNNENFLELYNFIDINDLSLSINYEIVEDWMDIDNFIDYQIFEIFIANTDWPSNNMKCWRERKNGAKWRWIFFDGDAALSDNDFEGFKQALSTGNDDWPTNALSTLFFRKLLENSTFYNKFILRLEYLLNYKLNLNNIVDIYQDIYFTLQPEIENQSKRFNKPTSYNHWNEAVYNVLSFFLNRPCIMKSHVLETFNKEICVKSCNITSIEPNNNEIKVSQYLGGINVNFNSKEDEKIQIYLINVIGERKLLFDGYISKGENSINTTSLNISSGFYVLNIQSKSKFLSKKIIIEN